MIVRVQTDLFNVAEVFEDECHDSRPRPSDGEA